MSTPPSSSAMIEFFFDCSSPWTYLAFHQIQPMAAEIGVPVSWRPILVGGVFNAVNPSVYAARDNPVPAKQRYMLKANTEELVQRGGFGSPTMFIGDDMYFGNDRLPLLRAAALRQKAAQQIRRPAPAP